MSACQTLADSVIARGAHNVDLPTWLAAQEVVWHREQEGRGAIPESAEVDAPEKGWVCEVRFRETKDAPTYHYWCSAQTSMDRSSWPHGVGLHQQVGRSILVETNQSWQSGEAFFAGVVSRERLDYRPAGLKEIIAFR